jgi:hypothetical protein
MASMFWDSEGVIHVGFLPHGETINAPHYSSLLGINVHQVIWMNCQRRFSYCMTVLVRIRQIRQRQHWQQWAGKS